MKAGSLQLDAALLEFINSCVLPEAGVNQAAFWTGFSRLVSDLTPKNRALLSRRDQLQMKINDWHNSHSFDFQAYQTFLGEIGYVEAEVEDFNIETNM